MNEQIDWSKAPEGATHYYQATEEWYLAGDGCVPRVWVGMWCKAFQFAQREHECIKRPSTPSWSGEGLPPVGVVCEVRNAPGGWGKATIKYQGKGIIVWLWDRPDGNTDQIEFASCPDRLQFRPIRTPEQIAADEREAAIKEIESLICGDYYSGVDTARIIYDAGYRKP